MMPDDITYRSQDVNYLGFLEAQLRDLQGIATLAYELIQNADDVRDAAGRPQADFISFDVTDEALVVENDGAFRPVDFARLQSLAGGAKREEAGTAGAFGVGFLSVFQITDSPEIFSNDRHWIIRPEAPPEQRIAERTVETSGTRFYLPWAFDENTEVRQRLRLPAVQPEQLEQFTRGIAQAIELAALFLQQLQRLEVSRGGTVIKRIERESTDEVVHLRNEKGRTATWLLYNGDFADAAEALRERYPWQIEAKRNSDVRLALPTDALQRQGRLFAVLPTEMRTPLPFHINADFFPTSDRKRIHLQSGYQSEWNRAAIEAAARVLASHLRELPERMGPNDFWQLLQQLADAHNAADAGDIPAVFATFWEAVATQLQEIPLLYTSQGKWQPADDVRLLPEAPLQEALPLLQALAIPVLHPDLAPYVALMRRPEIGAAPVSLGDIITGLNRAGLLQFSPRLPMFEAPPFLGSLDALQTLWRVVDTLLQRAPHEREEALAALAPYPLVLTDLMELRPLGQVYRGKEEAKALFPEVAWLHDLAPEGTYPGRYVPDFGVRQAVEILAETPPDQLEEAWHMGRLDLPRLFRWFESQQIEIFADDPALQREIRRVPLIPVAGELRPLRELYIPGGFDDPLDLTGLIEPEAVGGRRQFLQDLGVQQLDFEHYLHEEMPRALTQHPDIPSDARHRLLQLLARRLGEFRDDEELQEQLVQLPLIPCMDGSFRPAPRVYLSREMLGLLGEQVHIAEPPTSDALKALYEWLGVREEATVADLMQALRQVAAEKGGQPLARATRSQVEQLWLKLQQQLEELAQPPAVLYELQRELVVPDGQGNLRRPEALFFADAPELAALFADLEVRLLAPAHPAAGALALAGVRPLSAAVEPQLLATGEEVAGRTVVERITGRHSLIMRILRGEPAIDEDLVGLDFLQDLQVLQVDTLQRYYRLQAGQQIYRSEPDAVTAQLDGERGILYLSYEGQEIPWLATARELALAIKGEGVPGGLAIAIREVLAADSFSSASQILDELGYPS